MIRIGIAGTGGMAAQRAECFSGMEGVSVTGVYSRSLEKTQALCTSTGASAYDDFGAMAANCDAVALCLPNDLHAEFARKALTAGKHVLVEYPLCTCLGDAAELRSLSADSGRVLMVGNTIIHEAMFAYLTEHKDRLGRILNASSRVAFFSMDVAGCWYMRPERTGPVFAGLHYHHIEYYKRLLGEVEWARGVDQSLPDESRPGYMKLAGGALFMGHRGGAASCVQWYLSASGSGACPRGIWINGTDASVTIISQETGRSHVVWDDGSEIDTYEDDWGVHGSCRDFADAVRGKMDYLARLDEDMETLRIGHLAAAR